jgi:hypothetical protein
MKSYKKISLMILTVFIHTQLISMQQHEFPNDGPIPKRQCVQHADQDQKATAEQVLLEKYSYAVTPAQIEKVTKMLSQSKDEDAAQELALWLSIKGNPNSYLLSDPLTAMEKIKKLEQYGMNQEDWLLSQVYGPSALSTAIRSGNVQAVKVLLSDPRTIITDSHENDFNMCTALQNAIELGQDGLDDVKILRMLIFLGFDPTILRTKKMVLNPQEFATMFNDTRDYTNFYIDYMNKEKYFSDKEIKEFEEIVERRNKLLFTNMMAQKMRAHKQPLKMYWENSSIETKNAAESVSFSWPSKVSPLGNK